MKAIGDILHHAEEINSQKIIEAVWEQLNNSEFYKDGQKTYSV